MNNRVFICIDGNNLFYSAKSHSLKLDYAKLVETLLDNRELMRATFYTSTTEESDKQKGFIHWLRCNGFRVVSRTSRPDPFDSDSSRSKPIQRKSGIEIEMITDILLMAPGYDTLVLVSGDEDFAYPLRNLAMKGVRVEVASFKQSISTRLAEVADDVIYLDGMVDQIRKDEDSDSFELSPRTSRD